MDKVYSVWDAFSCHGLDQFLEFMPRRIEAVLAAGGGQTPFLRHFVGVFFILAVTCMLL